MEENSRTVAMYWDGGNGPYTVEVEAPDSDGDIRITVYRNEEIKASFYGAPEAIRRLARELLWAAN